MYCTAIEHFREVVDERVNDERSHLSMGEKDASTQREKRVGKEGTRTYSTKNTVLQLT